jgi:rhodanese-related sulfurtransferase
MGLLPQHIQILLERGLTPTEIEQAGFRSWEPGKRVTSTTSQLAGIDSRGDRLVGSWGIFIPAHNPNGNITGAQLKTDNGRPGKYIWLSSRKEDGTGGNGPHLPNGELPLFVWKRPEASQISLVILCEGALKSALAAFLLWRMGFTDIAVIGTAAGGFYGPDTLKSYIEQLSPQRVALAPDAGAINNIGNIPAANRQTIKRCQAWGYPVDVLWWGQTHKTKHLDIDELLVAGRWGEVQTITPDEFFQLHPVATREKLENHIPQRAGLHRSDFPVANPHPNKDVRTPEIEYQFGQRRQTWISLVEGNGTNIILDGSAMGLGKTHDVGLLQPSDFGVSQLIFVTDDPRNVTTETLKDWTVNQGRHGGLVEVPGPNSTTQVRRAKKGETPNIKSNCDRHQLAEILPARNVEATGAHICPGCKHRKTCKLGTGEFTYLFDRQSALSEERFISHIDSLDPRAFPGDYNNPGVVLVLDEASQQKLVKSFLVRWSDIDRTLADLRADHPTEATQLEPALNALRSLRGHVPLTTIDHLEVLKLLPELPDLSDEDIQRISHQGLEFLELDQLIEKYGFAAGTRLSDLPRDVQHRIRQDAQQLADQAEQAIALRWLPEFWQAMRSNERVWVAPETPEKEQREITYTYIDARLRLTPEGLQITHVDTHRRKVLFHPAVKAVILLDATEPPQHFNQGLGVHISSYIRQADPELVAEVEVVQVTGLGLMGFNRGKEQQQRSNTVVESLLLQHPNAPVINAQEYARSGDGYWFRDNRARNYGEQSDTLILVGAPFPSLGASVDEFALMTGRHPDTSSVLRSYTIDAINTPAGGPWWVRTVNELADPEAAAFYRHRVQAELDQAIGRLRGNRRPGEKLTIYVLSDYPLSRPVRLVEASALAPEATPKAVATDQRIEQAIAQLEEGGNVTLKVIAQVAKVSLGRVAKSEAWKSRQKRISVWSVDFPNAINNIPTWKNYKPPVNIEPEPTTAVAPETVPAAVEPRAITPIPTPQNLSSCASRGCNLPIDSEVSTSTPKPQPDALLQAVEILTRCGQWLTGYFYVGRKGDCHQLQNRNGYRGIFVTDDEFRFAAEVMT